MSVCDGCGAKADDAHVRARIERLELATRYRPIHINVLLIDAAPFAAAQDCFYSAAADRSVRSIASRVYFDEVMKCAGFRSDAAIQEDAALAEFQWRGFFLASAVECPMTGKQSELETAVRSVTPTVLKRVQLSYKPKHIALLSNATRDLIRALGEAGWKDRLILDGGGPFFDPFLNDPPAQAEFATAFGDRLAKALPHANSASV
jgi:hypothetical protein